MKNSTIIIISISALAFLMVGVAISIDRTPLDQTPLGNVSSGTSEGFNIATNSSSSVQAVNTEVFTANASRIYASITNNSTNDIWCSLTTANAVIGEGTRIVATDDTTGEVKLEFGVGFIPYTGEVNCISSATSTIGTIEK